MNTGKEYTDRRGWWYKVMGGIGGNTFKARYLKPDWEKRTGWKCVQSLPWRDTAEEAQKDLDEYAKAHGWTPAPAKIQDGVNE